MSDVVPSGELLPKVRLDELEALAQTSPELAERVLRVVAERAATRSVIERRQQGIQTLGIISALLVALAFGYWSFLLISQGEVVGGSIMGAADLTALVAAFIAGGRRS